MQYRFSQKSGQRPTACPNDGLNPNIQVFFRRYLLPRNLVGGGRVANGGCHEEAVACRVREGVSHSRHGCLFLSIENLVEAEEDDHFDQNWLQLGFRISRRPSAYRPYLSTCLSVSARTSRGWRNAWSDRQGTDRMQKAPEQARWLVDIRPAGTV